MKQAVLAILSLFLLQLSAAAAFGLEVNANVDRTSIGPGESVNLTVVIKDGKGEVDLSSIKDFKVISRGKSSNFNFINGNASKEIRYSYTLLPLKEGSLVVPVLKIVSKGKTFHTKQININVAKDSGTSSEESRDIFVLSSVSNKEPCEGEQIIYTFRLYNNMQVTNPKFQKPDFEGFDAKQTGESRSFGKLISGIEYTVTELNYVLIPVKTGPVTIKPAVLSCDIVRRGRGNYDSFFNNGFFSSANLEPRALKTKALKVDVKSLPDYEGSVRFSGLVGSFQIKGNLKNSKIDTGDSTTLTIIINGAGNIMDAEFPDIRVPDSFKTYKDSPVEDINLENDGYSGKKTFNIALVGLKPGIYSFEPVKICYFDTGIKNYKIISTDPFYLTVNQAENKENLQVFSVDNNSRKLLGSKKKVKFTGHDILPLKDNIDALKTRRSTPLYLFIILITAPGIIFSALKLYLIFTQKTDDIGQILTQKAKNTLKDSFKPGISDETLFSLLYRAATYAIYSKAGVKGETLTYAEAKEILMSNGYSDEISKKAAELLKDIESARYSGADMSADLKNELLKNTGAFLKELLK